MQWKQLVIIFLSTSRIIKIRKYIITVERFDSKLKHNRGTFRRLRELQISCTSNERKSDFNSKLDRKFEKREQIVEWRSWEDDEIAAAIVTVVIIISWRRK